MGAVSIQVLQEWVNVVTRRVPVPLTLDEAARAIEDFDSAGWRIISPQVGDVIECHRSIGDDATLAIVVVGRLNCEGLDRGSESWTEVRVCHHSEPVSRLSRREKPRRKECSGAFVL